MSYTTGSGAIPPKKSCFNEVTSRPTRVVSPSLTWGAVVVRESNELNRTWNCMVWQGNEEAVENHQGFIRILSLSYSDRAKPLG